MVKVSKIKGKEWNSHSYVVGNADQVILIDTGGEDDDICKAIGSSQLCAILLTHGHYDHVKNASVLKEKYGASVYLHTGDKRLVKHANLYLKMFHGKDFIQIPEIDYWLEDGQELDFACCRVRVIHSPGHTAGSVCFQIDGFLFTGDLLFKNNVGRGDLPGGDEKQLWQSLSKLCELVEDARVFAGHGEPTDLSYEKQHNVKLVEIIVKESEHKNK